MILFVYDQKTETTFEIEVNVNSTIELIRSKISKMLNLRFDDFMLSINNEEIFDSELTVGQLNLKEYDVIKLIEQKYKSAIRLEALKLIQRAQKNPEYLSRLIEADYKFAEQLISENIDLIESTLLSRSNSDQSTYKMAANKNNTNFYEENKNKMLKVNNFDLNMQSKIESEIRINRINLLYENAFEHYPELFVPTKMLFINGSVNKVTTKIFIDTGAANTIVSKKFIEKVHLMKDVDVRVNGIVKGVGSQRSIGRIWMFELFIKNRCFLLSATVLEQFDFDILLGLDMMKRHQCVIDLGKHEIKFGVEQVTEKFISDYELG